MLVIMALGMYYVEFGSFDGGEDGEPNGVYFYDISTISMIHDFFFP